MVVKSSTIGRVVVYLIDWAIIVGTGVAVKFINEQSPKTRPFSLVNPSLA